MGTGSLFVYGLRRFRGNARPLPTKTVFAVASIDIVTHNNYISMLVNRQTSERKQEQHKKETLVSESLSTHME